MTNRSSKTQPKSTIGAVRYVYVQFIRPHRTHRIDEAFATLCRTFRDVCVSACRAHLWALQKRLNGSRSMRGCDAALCHITLSTCFLNCICSVLFFSRPLSEGWPLHGRTFSIYPCPLSFWLTVYTCIKVIQSVDVCSRLCSRWHFNDMARRAVPLL